jgi:addiction module HigA family antidote
MAKTTVLVPGDVLKGLLESYRISVAKASEDIGLSQSAIRQITGNKLKISTIIALKLAKYFDKKPEYWINLQTGYDLSQLQKDAKINAGLKSIPKAQKQPAPKAPVAAKKTKAAAGAKKSPNAKGTVKKPRTPKAKPAPDSN